MLKKIIMWAVFASLVGLMVFGTVNRTAVKTDRDTGIQNRSEKRTELVQARDGLGNKTQIGGLARNGQSGGSGSNGQGVDPGVDLREISPEDHNWSVVTGSIVELDSSSLMIQLKNAEILVIEGRAWRFAAESGYSPNVGSHVEVTGFYEDGEYKVSEIRDLTSGQIYYLRDETGRPLWSGAGNSSDL